MPHGVSRIKVVVPQPVHCKMCLRADISEMICICNFNKLVECPCIATGVDFFNAKKEYTRQIMMQIKQPTGYQQSELKIQL